MGIKFAVAEEEEDDSIVSICRLMDHLLKHYCSPSTSTSDPFQGQMLYVEEFDLMLFQCYPSVLNLDDVTK